MWVESMCEHRVSHFPTGKRVSTVKRDININARASMQEVSVTVVHKACGITSLAVGSTAGA